MSSDLDAMKARRDRLYRQALLLREADAKFNAKFNAKINTLGNASQATVDALVALLVDDTPPTIPLRAALAWAIGIAPALFAIVQRRQCPNWTFAWMAAWLTLGILLTGWAVPKQ